MLTSRLEHDFLGERAIPANAYYGIQTLRALGYVKKAAALANRDMGVLDPTLAGFITQACDRVIAGELDDQFQTDMIQGGAGTSVNMNANEVIANVALELMDKPKGAYEFCHPNNHVNCSQSTNDAYPTAFRIALNNKLVGYSQALGELADAFAEKGEEFRNVLKMGRTQLQDAVPMSMGDEFKAFATNLREELLRIQDSRNLISEINMGATAIGTRVNAPTGYAEIVTAHLRDITGLELVLAGDLIEATYDTGAYVQLSGVLKRTAVKLSKICNDLRLLSSGPRAVRNQPAAAATRVEHYAGQSESGGTRGSQPNGLLRHWGRPHGNYGSRSRATATERNGASYFVCSVYQHFLPNPRLSYAPREVCGRHHGQCPARRKAGAQQHRHRYTTEPGFGLRNCGRSS
jgi:aspartate ammonia-lyase